jgi:RNA polymerase sigma factor (sigma-70 family)
MTRAPPLVYVVDDDASVRKALTRLLATAGYEVRAFASAQDFVNGHDPATGSCVVLDLSMPGIDGLVLQASLNAEASVLPIVFLSGRGDVPSSVQAMKQGAVDFLQKPIDDALLFAAVARGCEQVEELRRAREDRQTIEARLATLTPRERQVLSHLITGRLNKQIAADLGTSEKTIKVHRARILQKMCADSIASLVRIADRGGIAPSPPTSP